MGHFVIRTTFCYASGEKTIPGMRGSIARVRGPVIAKSKAAQFSFVRELPFVIVSCPQKWFSCSRITPLSLGAESLASSFNVANGNEMITLVQADGLLRGTYPRGTQSEEGSAIFPHAFLLVRWHPAQPPPVLPWKKLLGGTLGTHRVLAKMYSGPRSYPNIVLGHLVTSK